MPWTRSVAENVVANLIASAITGVGAALISKASDLPTISAVFVGVGVFSVSLLVLLVMAIKLDQQAKAEASLPLLREVGIHMLLNRIGPSSKVFWSAWARTSLGGEIVLFRS